MAKTELTNDDLAEVLEQARDLMNDSGAHWTQGAFRRTDRKTKEVSYCSVGAIRAVTPDRKLREAAYKALMPASNSWSPMNRLMGWNDTYNRTWKEIDRRFRETAKKLRARKTRSPHLP